MQHSCICLSQARLLRLPHTAKTSLPFGKSEAHSSHLLNAHVNWSHRSRIDRPSANSTQSYDMRCPSLRLTAPSNHDVESDALTFSKTPPPLVNVCVTQGRPFHFLPHDFSIMHVYVFCTIIGTYEAETAVLVLIDHCALSRAPINLPQYTGNLSVNFKSTRDTRRRTPVQ